MPKKEKNNQKNKNNIQENPPILTEEQQKERRRNEYIARLDEYAKLAKDPYKPLKNVYGMYGSMPDGMKNKENYDVLRTSIPTGTSEIFATAVALGALMEPSRLDRNMTGSGFPAGAGTYVDFNQLFLLDNIPKQDKRHGAFPPLLLAAREEAQEALRIMQDKKDGTLAYKYMNSFMRYAAKSITSAMKYHSGSMMSESEYVGTKQALRMAAELISNEPYSSHIDIPEFERMKIMAFANQAAVREQIYTEKSALMKNPPAAGSPEREEAVAELMFKEYLIGTLSNDKSIIERQRESTIQDIMHQHGLDATSKEYDRLLNSPQYISDIGMKSMKSMDDYLTTDREVILARPDGVNTLRSMYMDSIRKTKTFKDLVAAEGEQFLDQLIELDDTASKSFRNFPEVKVESVAEHFNAQHREDLGRVNEEISATVDEVFEGFARSDNMITSYTQKNLTKNRRQIEKLLTEFTENEKLLPDDSIIKEIDKGLRSLSDQAKSMEKAGKASGDNLKGYTNTIDEISRNINRFFETNGNSPAADQVLLYMNLRRLSRHLKWNKRGIMEPERRREREQIFRDNRDTYEKPNPGAIDEMVRIRREQLTDEMIGATIGEKMVKRNAITATEKLAEMIKAGKLPDQQNKAEVVGYVRDLFVEHIFRKADPYRTGGGKHEPERYVYPLVEKLPEYKTFTEKFTMTDLGQIVFQGRIDQLLIKYDQNQLLEKFDAESSLETERGTEQIEREMARRAAEEEERIRLGVRDEFIREARLRKEDHYAPLRMLNTLYGAKPRMHSSIRLSQEYNDLRLENPPKGLDENTITAIVLGSIMKKERMDQPMTSSSFMNGTSAYLEFNRNFLIDNLAKNPPDSERQGNFGLALVEGRREALEAIEEYRNGHPEKAKAMLETFVDAAADAEIQASYSDSANMTVMNYSTVQRAFHQLGAEMMGKPPFNVTGTKTEVRRIHSAANEQTMLAMHRIYDTKYDLMTKPSAAGSKERMREIDNLLFDQYLMSTMNYTNKEKEIPGDQWSKKISDKYGLDESYDPDAYDDVHDELINGTVGVQEMWNCRESFVTEYEVMMATEKGREKLRELYLPEIRKTKIYRSLVEGKGDDYVTLLRESEEETRRGFQSFKGVKLPNEARAINEKNRPNWEKKNAELEELMDEQAVKSVRNMQSFKGYDKASMQNNASHLGYLTELMNQEIMRTRQLPKPTKTIIKQLQNSVANFVRLATNLSKKKTAPTSADMKNYENQANQITRLADGFTEGNPNPTDDVEKAIFLSIRRVGFMAKVNSDLVTYPAKLADRKARIRKALGEQDPKRAADYRAKYPKADPKSADFRYAVLTNDALKTLNEAALATLDESKSGSNPMRRRMIGKARTAVHELARMINKGEDHISKNQDQAREWLKDIIAERAMAIYESKKLFVRDGDTSLRQLAEKLPLFNDALKRITCGTIGTFLFENEADRILGKYKQEDLDKAQTGISNEKRDADLREIERREVLAFERQKETEKKKIEENNKNEIIDHSEDNKNEIIDHSEDNKNEIIDHSEDNKNEIIDRSGKKGQIIIEDENSNIIHEESDDEIRASEKDFKSHVQKKDAPAVPEKGQKKKQKKIQEPAKEEEPVEYVKTMLFSDQMYKEPQAEEPKIKEEPKIEEKPGIKEDQKLEEDHKMEERPKTIPIRRAEKIDLYDPIREVSDIDRRSEISLDEDSIGDDNIIITTSKRAKGSKARSKAKIEGMNDPASAEDFLKKVSKFHYTRQVLIRTIYADMEAILNMPANKTTAKDDAFYNELRTCRAALGGDSLVKYKHLTPERMWNFMSDLAVQAKYFKPEWAAKYGMMASIFGEAIRPLEEMKGNNLFSKGKNGTEAQIRELNEVAERLKFDHDLDEPGELAKRNAYLQMEENAKLKYVLRNRLSKATGMDIDGSPFKKSPDDYVIELHEPETVREAALSAVAKFFMVTADKADSNADVLRGLIAVVDNKGFKAQVDELEANPVFRKVFERHPEDCYNRWKKITDRAAGQRQEAAEDLSRMAGNGSLAGYVAFGEEQNQIEILNIGRNAENQRNVRLAKVLSAKLLSDMKMSTLRQAVGAGMIKVSDIEAETLAFVERKRIRIMDNNGRINREFRRKLEDGTFQKELIKTQARFLEQARNRRPEQKRALTEKLNLVQKPAANPRIM